MIIRSASCQYSVDMICAMEQKHHGVNIDSSISQIYLSLVFSFGTPDGIRKKAGEEKEYEKKSVCEQDLLS